MTRRNFTEKTRAAMLLRSEGRCEGMVDATGRYVGARGDDGDGWQRCGAKIGGGVPWVADHIIPDALDGLNDADNGQCLCGACNAEKTGKQDVPAIAKAQRNARRAAGIKRQPKRKLGIPGLKRKISGEVVER